MKNLNVCIALFFMSCMSFGQKNNLPKLKFTIGYYGETITHTGATIGIEYYPYQNSKYQMILATNIGGYQHIRNNTSFFIREQWGQRVTFENGLFIDEFLGLGYLRHYTNGGDNFEVLPNGAVVEIPNSGRSMFMPSIGLGTGYDFSKKSKLNVIIYVRPELFWKAPFNGYYLTHFALNTGIIFKI